MNVEEFSTFCLSKKGVTESFPFDETTLVMKVMNKIFAMTNLDGYQSINLKCTPENVIDRIERFPAVQAGYHMNKKHWITVLIDGSISNTTIMDWIDESYNLVVKSLTKKEQTVLKEL